MLIEELTHEHRNLAAEHEVLLHLRTAQIEVTILQANHLIDVDAILNVERRRLRLVQDAQLRADDLDLTRIDIRVDRLFAARTNLAAHGDAELITQGLRLVERALCHRRFVEDNLHESGTVAHVDENQSTVIAAAGNPAAQDDLSADVGFTQYTAMMGALHTF